MSRKSGKIKRIVALLLTAVFLTASIHLDTTAAENTVPGNTKENPATAEIQEGAPSATAENETPGESLTETTEDKIPEEPLTGTTDNETPEDSLSETADDKTPEEAPAETFP